MKKLTLCLGLLISGIMILGQSPMKTGKVGGIIHDASNKPIEGASISVLRGKDSAMVKVSFSDKAGKFEVKNLAEGKYIVMVSAVGHAKRYTNAFELSPGQVSFDLQTIGLKNEVKNLQAVTVVSTRPPIEQKIDRTVVNVEASVTNAGATALEVLEKSPGITVDKDGNISLKGKQGVIILIDGRQTYLSGTDLANMLRNMTASQLDQIEIMTNPPAKFDAAGNSGVINIKTKKNKQMGYNGSITLGYGQGRLPKFNESINMNYKKGKINLFTNLSHNYRKNFNNLTIQRNFREKNTKELLSYFDQEARMRSQNSYYSGKIGLDYYATKKTTVGVVFSGFINPEKFANSNITDISDALGNILNQTRATSRFDQRWKNYSSNLNFRHLLDTAGRELTADADYIRYSATNDQTLINSYFDRNNQAIQIPDTLIGGLPQDIEIYSGKIDYVHPLKKGAKFEAGIKTSFVKTDNDARYDSLLNGEFVADYGRSNHFIYEENINAAYVNYSKPFSKKFTGQLGLRLENTNAKGTQLGNLVQQGSTFERNYTQLFPTAFFQYTIDKNNKLGLNYGRRIQRPNYQSLNPFIYFLDRYTYEQGNPNLQPQFSHNVELSHTLKNFFTTTVNYTRTTDIIQQVIEQNEETNETFVKRSNIARQRQYGVSLSAFKQITKWWSGNIYANVYNNKFEGIVNETEISVGGTTLVLNASQQFKFKQGWGAELSGFYRTQGIEGVFIIKPLGMMNVGVSKQILKNNGSIRLNVRDVLYTQKFRGESKYSNIDAAFQNTRDSRVFNLSFSYRFSKGKVNGSQRKKGSASDEENRVGIGNSN